MQFNFLLTNTLLGKHLDRTQAEQICASLSPEAIETLLWNREGETKWIKNANLPQPTLATRIIFQNL